METVKCFYTDVVGMSVMQAITSPTSVTLRAPDGGATLGLQDKAASVLPPCNETQPGTAELSCEVDDVDASWARRKAHDVTLVSEPLDLPRGRYLLAQDPEGRYLSAYRFARRTASGADGASASE